MPTYIVTFMDLYEGRERQKETEAASPAEAIRNVRARIALKERKIPVRRLEPELYYRFRAEIAPLPPPPEPMEPPPGPRRCPPPEPTLFNPSGTSLEVYSGEIVYDGRGIGVETVRNPQETAEVGRAWAERRGLNIVVKPPSACTPEELAGFKELVLREWQVSDEGLDTRIARSKILVIIYGSDGAMIGIGAAKKPQESYAKRVFRSAGVPNWQQYDYELGYFFIVPEYRGNLLSRVIMESLIDSCGEVSLFATTRTDNERMIRTNRRLGFAQVGNAFRSERGAWNIFLWTRNVGGTAVEEPPDGLAFVPGPWEEQER